MTNPRRARSVAWRRLGEETVIVDLAGRRMLGLEPVGGWIWSQLDGRPLATIVAAASALPGVHEGTGEEISAFVESLVERGLAEVGEPAPPIPLAPPPETWQRPTIRWDEPLQQVAASCAFLPGQSPLCSQVPSV